MIYRVASEWQIYRNSWMLVVQRGEARGGDIEVLIPTWRKIAPGEMFPAETLLHDQEFQTIMRAFADEAWAKGIRPSNHQAADNTAVLDSTRYHLEDMRRLVFNEKVPDLSRAFYESQKPPA